MDRPKDPTRLHHEDTHRPRGGVFFDYELTLDPFIHRLLGNLDDYEKRSRQASRILSTLGDPFWDQVSESRSRLARGKESETNTDRSVVAFSENLLEEKARYPDASSTIRKVGEALAGLSSRMRPASSTVPKPMVLIQGRRLIETQLDALIAAGIFDITIVRGYLGEAFDYLLADYPEIKFIDSANWRITGAIMSAALAIDLLAGAYLIEGDLYIKNPRVIRPYEYRSSYCGIEGPVDHDWHFSSGNNGLIKKLGFGDIIGNPRTNLNVTYKFVGIMYWTTEDAKTLKVDLKNLLQDPSHHQRFIESVPFDAKSANYQIFARAIHKSDVTEVDTFQELQILRTREKLNQELSELDSGRPRSLPNIDPNSDNISDIGSFNLKIQASD
jgi:CTP:phosphocholine cytidylyltransferase-like protein